MRITVIIALAFALAGTATAAPPPLPVDEQRILAEVEQLIDQTGVISEDDALAAWELVARGNRAHDEQRYERALELYRQALEKDPVNAMAYYELALTHSRRGDQVKALDAVIRALALDPKLEASHVVKAAILDDLGYRDLAVAAYKTLLDVQPESFSGHLNLAITYLRTASWAEAEKHLEIAREIAPDHPSPYFHLAHAAREQGHDYEETEWVDKFLAVAPPDEPRRAVVERRREELTRNEIQIDPTAPFLSLELIEQMARANWRTEKHRQTFPEARGYFPSLEEELAIYRDLVLPAWREEKANDPSAAHPFYDFLLRVSEAGFLSEYLCLDRQDELGERGEQWLAEHQDRVDQFRAWMETVDEADRPAAPPPEEGVSAKDFLAAVVEIAAASELNYTVRQATAAEIADHLRREGRLFRRKLRLAGSEQADCGIKIRELRAAIPRSGAVTALVDVFRCFLPGDKEWEEASRLLSTVGNEFHEVESPIRAVVQRRGDEIVAGFDTYPWMFYALSKAVWKNEATVRSAFVADLADYRPTVVEERNAFAAMIQGYLSVMESEVDEEAEGDLERNPDPYLDYLVEVAGHDQLTGFVLFEVLHKTYGVSLRSLEPDHYLALVGYLNRFFLAPATPPNPR